MEEMMEQDIRNRFFLSLIFTIPILIFSYTKILDPVIKNWILLLLTTPVVLKFGSIFPLGAWQSLKNKTLNMMVLITIGVFAAYLFSVFVTVFTGSETFFEAAAMLVTFVLFGHWMEMKSRRGTSDALKTLFNLIPPQSRIISNDKEIIINTSEIKIGDIIILKPGDKVPVDVQIIKGETSIDESLITGESLPITKNKNDQIIAGSINQTGSVQFKATKIGSDTVLFQIIKLVQTAQNSKAPGQRLADKWAQYLVILAVGSGLITFSIWYFFFGSALQIALAFAISAIVIACPDALGLATPTAVAVGTGLGAKHNILIKDAATLERLSKINAIVLDKTGTLTEGKPIITDIIALNHFTADQILKLVAALEKLSNHPLSLAILNEAKKRKISIPTKVEKFKSISGYGLEGKINNKSILIGNVKLMGVRKINLKSIQDQLNKFFESGKTIILLALDNKISGLIAITDPLKSNSQIAVQKMQEIGIKVFMITGDNQKTAQKIVDKLSIDKFFAEVLPEDKEKYIKKLQDDGKFVAMVGNGINDAPALAQADIGIAIGTGTDVAIETAQVVLMKSDPLDILRAIKISQTTVNKMKQNLVWASVYNVLAIPIAAGILYPKFGITLRPEISALLMSVSSIIVALNAVSLKHIEKNL
jgi:P-type Cu2+ transporter